MQLKFWCFSNQKCIKIGTNPMITTMKPREFPGFVVTQRPSSMLSHFTKLQSTANSQATTFYLHEGSAKFRSIMKTTISMQNVAAPASEIVCLNHTLKTLQRTQFPHHEIRFSFSSIVHSPGEGEGVNEFSNIFPPHSTCEPGFPACNVWLDKATLHGGKFAI